MTIEFSSVEIARLGRFDDWTASDLAQELQSLLPELYRDIPAARLVAKATDEFPSPIEITDFSTNGDAPFATYRRGSDTYVVNIGPNGLTTDATPAAGPAAAQAFAGFVASYIGANVYTVTLVPSGTTVNATQLQGDAAIPHAAGSYALLFKIGGTYYMQIPVWA